MIVDNCFIPTDYDKPFAVSTRPILNGVLEKGYKIISDKQFFPYIDGKQKFRRVLIQKDNKKTKVANNVAKFVNSRYFTRAEYIDYKEDEETGTVVIDLIDGRKLKIYRVKVIDWLGFYCNTTEEEVHKLTQNHGSCYK